MTTGRSEPPRLLTFGDPDGEIWGLAADVADPVILLHTRESSGSARVAFERGETTWRVSGEAVDLEVGPPASATRPSEVGDELCRVEGTIRVGDTQHPVSCPGIRSTLAPGPLAEGDSVRIFSGWFAEDRAVVLRAHRRAGSRGQEKDGVVATLFDPEEWIPVADPRLSTTFQPPGHPARVGLELWVGPEEEQYPRRAAAEASGTPLRAEAAGAQLSLTPMRCHSGGLDGAGVYLIANL